VVFGCLAPLSSSLCACAKCFHLHGIGGRLVTGNDSGVGGA
jgi:hypothetical protein